MRGNPVPSAFTRLQYAINLLILCNPVAAIPQKMCVSSGEVSEGWADLLHAEAASSQARTARAVADDGGTMSFTTDMSNSGEILSRALRAIRRKRGLKTSEVASRMDMPQRSYELFEAGGGRITFERLMAFAEATDCDPFALMLVGPFGSADIAIHCADTKLVMIMAMTLQEFAEDRGADLNFLEPPNIIAASQRLFRDLGGKLDDNEAFLSKWMDGRTGIIDLASLSMRGIRRKKA